jgi:hypothetical protein
MGSKLGEENGGQTRTLNAGQNGCHISPGHGRLIRLRAWFTPAQGGNAFPGEYLTLLQSS